MLYLRDYGETEVGGFGIATTDDLLSVHDIRLVRQDCSCAHVAFDDDSVADFFDEQVDGGLRPEQFARIWIHTHPGDSPHPSSVDEETFQRVFGNSDWAVMFILACGGESYAQLRFNQGPCADLVIPVEIDFTKSFMGSDTEGWEADYLEYVYPQNTNPNDVFECSSKGGSLVNVEVNDFRNNWFDYANFDEEEFAYE